MEAPGEMSHMRATFPKVYQSFAEFEREELKKFDGFGQAIDGMMDDAFSEMKEESEPRQLDFD